MTDVDKSVVALRPVFGVIRCRHPADHQPVQTLSEVLVGNREMLSPLGEAARRRPQIDPVPQSHKMECRCVLGCLEHHVEGHIRLPFNVDDKVGIAPEIPLAAVGTGLPKPIGHDHNRGEGRKAIAEAGEIVDHTKVVGR